MTLNSVSEKRRQSAPRGLALGVGHGEGPAGGVRGGQREAAAEAGEVPQRYHKALVAVRQAGVGAPPDVRLGKQVIEHGLGEPGLHGGGRPVLRVGRGPEKNRKHT